MSIPTNFMPLVPKVFEDALAGWEAELEDKVGKKLVCITKVGLSLSTTMNRNLALTPTPPPPPTHTQLRWTTSSRRARPPSREQRTRSTSPYFTTVCQHGGRPTPRPPCRPELRQPPGPQHHRQQGHPLREQDRGRLTRDVPRPRLARLR